MPKFSVRKPLTVFMAAIIVVILGVVAYTRMTPDLLPNIDMPYVMIMTTYPGATPEKVETVISKPMEQSMATLENIENIQSISSANASTLILEFNEDVNMDTISVDILQKINLIQGYWDDTVGTPVILKMNPSMLPVAVAAVSVEGMDQTALSDFVSDTLMNQLEGTGGVASISTTGVLEEQMNVVIRQDKIDAVNQRIRDAIDRQIEQQIQDAQSAQMDGMQNLPPQALEQMQSQAQAQMAQAKEEAYQAADISGLITMDMISGILTAQNFAMPAGYVEQEDVSYLVSVGDEIASLEELQNLFLMDMGIEGVEPVYLSDVADVFISDNAGESYAKINGKDGVLLSFSKQSNYATAKVSDQIAAKFEELEQKYEGLQFVTLMDQGDYIYMIIDSILQNLILGAIFAVLILFLFLKDLRPTFITLCSIPISVIFAIVLMYFSGVTLNVISMSGLAISVGMLVDNAVVVIENIYRLKNKGFSTTKAAVSGATQVAGAITASTLTTVCVFLPIVFVEGITKQLFVDLALTLGYSLLASLIIALTLVPAMASGMLRNVKQRQHKWFDQFLAGYQRLLSWALRRKVLVLGLALVLLVVSVAATVQRGFSFMPETNMPQLSLRIEMPEEADLEAKAEMADAVMEKVQSVPEVENVGAMIGSSGAMGMLGSSGSDTVTMYAILDEKAERSNQEIEAEILALCADLSCEITIDSSGMSAASSMLGGSGISIEVYGDELDTLQQAAKEIAARLQMLEGVAEVSDGIEETEPEIHFTVNKEEAMKNGLTVAQIYSEINQAMTKEKSAASVTFDGRDYDITVYAGGEQKLTSAQIRELEITVTDREGNEKKLAIGDVAQIEDQETLASIQRKNQMRYLTVTAELKEGYNVTLVTDEAKEALKDFEMTGITTEFSGENETIMESMTQLIQMLLLGIVLVYMIMVAQFQSLKSPFIIMFTIPLAFTGGLLALLFAGMEISIIAMLGFVMLSGIIVNNGIVLVDYINQLRIEGKEKKEAILEAGATRMRPILMTSLTTILGLSVMVLGIGQTSSGAEMMRPLAMVCIGGLIYATILTLFVVPALYDMMNRKPIKTVAKEDLEITNE